MLEDLNNAEGKNIRPLILGIEGSSLSLREVELFQNLNPWGIILFSRNVENKEQLYLLCSEFRNSVNRKNAPILIDQEGGRVQRLLPPICPDIKSMGEIGALYESSPKEGIALLRSSIGAICTALKGCGINANCAPVADLRIKAMHEVIGARAFSEDPEICKILSSIAIDVFLQNKITPILKHVPGYGRVKVDPHFDLPVVEETFEKLDKSDFIPFKNLLSVPAMMSAHIIYKNIDPLHAASQSKTIMHDLIRANWGYNGLIMSDDIMMKALKGSAVDRAIASLEAGNDIVLHCSGDYYEMKSLLEKIPTASNITQERMNGFTQCERVRE